MNPGHRRRAAPRGRPLDRPRSRPGAPPVHGGETSARPRSKRSGRATSAVMIVGDEVPHTTSTSCRSTRPVSCRPRTSTTTRPRVRSTRQPSRSAPPRDLGAEGVADWPRPRSRQENGRIAARLAAENARSSPTPTRDGPLTSPSVASAEEWANATRPSSGAASRRWPVTRRTGRGSWSGRGARARRPRRAPLPRRHLVALGHRARPPGCPSSTRRCVTSSTRVAHSTMLGNGNRAPIALALAAGTKKSTGRTCCNASDGAAAVEQH